LKYEYSIADYWATLDVLQGGVGSDMSPAVNLESEPATVSTKRRVLLVNAKRQKCESVSPHLGLAMLASILRRDGHDALVVDYQFRHGAPPLSEFVSRFKPDVIGFTIYTATMSEVSELIDEVAGLGIPIMVGGPHVTIYHDDLLKDARIDYVVSGEAEEVISGLVKEAVKSPSPKLMSAEAPPDPAKLPPPDFSAFHECEEMTIYPLQTSRGCPHNCCFCVVRLVSTRRWRPRDPTVCVEEAVGARKRFRKLDSLIVYDDHPMFRKEHVRTFLEGYISAGIDLPLTIVNTRADGLDEEIISLLKAARCPAIGMGVESGCPRVFETVGKGETLDDIRRAAKLVKSSGIPLALCFIIGLEGDTIETVKESASFARSLKPDHIFWNMMTPFEGTRIREWYDAHGRVYNVTNHSSYVDSDFLCDEPCAETPEFTLSDRKKAYFIAILETNDTRLKLKHIPRLLKHVIRFRLYGEFIRWLPREMVKEARSAGKLVRRAGQILKDEGPREAIRKIAARVGD